MPSSGERGTSILTRRRLLRLSSVGVVGSLAGCGDSAAPDTDTTDTTTPEPTDTDTTTPEPTDTDTTTPEQTDTTTESAPALTEYLGRSPGSHVAPADGFTDLSWIDEADLDVLKVTSLDSSGEGSLRWATEQSGPRLVVFEVGGVIDLQMDNIDINNEMCWIAGHTAPSPGITLIRGMLNLGTDKCIAQHVRSRPGDADADVGWQPDAIDTDEETQDNLIDHCTATWSVDEGISPGYYSRRTTVTNCIIAEGLDESTHPHGGHSFGSLTGNGAKEVVYAGNLWAHNTGRNPRLKTKSETVVANNIMYHFNDATDLDSDSIAAIHDNAYLRNEGSGIITGKGGTGSRASVEGNYKTGDARMTVKIDAMAVPPLWPQTLETIPAQDAIDAVLRWTGARPGDRTHHDQRIVQQVRERTGDFIDSQEEVGGYPDFEPTERSLDVPDRGDGLGEWLYQHRRAVELPDAQPP